LRYTLFPYTTLFRSPIENKWSEFSRITEGLSLNLPANILSSYIGHPMIALLLHIILFFMTFISVHLLLAIIFLVTQKMIANKRRSEEHTSELQSRFE